VRVLVAAVLVAGWAGCGFKPTDGTGMRDGGGGEDADAMVVRMDGCSTYSRLFDTCAMAGGGSAVTIIGPADYDTMTNTLTGNGSPPSHPQHVMVATAEGMIDVWIASSFTLTGKLRVHGTNAFGIAAETGITLDGQIDLTDAGAGARPDNMCVGLVGLPGKMMSNHGGGGGGGGLFGAGGDGMDSTTTNAVGGIGGNDVAPVHDGMLGGCDGGKGGDGNGGGTGGEAGDGGGAILLATAGPLMLTANGVVNVGGGGGHGGDSGGGGGGGGGGGTIVIEAFSLQNGGAIAANGGGGGEGGDSVTGMRGQTGQASSARALGGAGMTSTGGAGSLGGAGTTANGDDNTLVQANGGGGGGGAGAGYILIGHASPNGTISPPAISW
jgi:hypothetical protein